MKDKLELKTGRALIMEMSDERCFERFCQQVAGDAMLAYGELNPDYHKLNVREVAKIAARLAAERTAQAIRDAAGVREIRDALEEKRINAMSPAQFGDRLLGVLPDAAAENRD